jgi:hypothetical protein
MKNFNKSLHYETEFYSHLQEIILGKGKTLSWAAQSQLVGYMQPACQQLYSPDIDGRTDVPNFLAMQSVLHSVKIMYRNLLPLRPF